MAVLFINTNEVSGAARMREVRQMREIRGSVWPGRRLALYYLYTHTHT